MNNSPITPFDGNRIGERDAQLIEKLLDRMDKAHQTFSAELWIYRAGCLSAMIMVVFAAGRTIWFAAPGTMEIGTFLGSGGLFAISGDRTTRFLRENLNLLRDVILRLLPAARENG